MSPSFILLLSGIIATATDAYEYRVDGSPALVKEGFLVDFVPLTEDVRYKRQTSNSNNLSLNKTKPGSTPINLKLDKNSAMNPSDVPSSSVKKTLVETSLDERKLEDELISELTNRSLSDDLTSDRPKVYHDAHTYYNSTVVNEPERLSEFWVDLSKMGGSRVYRHEMLSKAYRKAATVTLSFDFPFYGHVIRNATIATGGFLYLGDFMHSWLASTQYIAPLMANFDTSLSDTSAIRYADNGTDFIVEWANTVLQDHKAAGPFTFQVRLKKTGDIIFVYKNIPVAINTISDLEHPVRIGISDAYIIDRTVVFQKRKVIYEYHRVEIDKQYIENLTAVYLKALPSCNTLMDCESCLGADIGFQCSWCALAMRCSDGMDRKRHDWILLGCDVVFEAPQTLMCPVPNITSLAGHRHHADDVGSFGPAGIIGILFVALLVFGFVAWIVYAYKNPHSPSGQIVIKYRPSQWHLLKGDADYTPASIHI